MNHRINNLFTKVNWLTSVLPVAVILVAAIFSGCSRYEHEGIKKQSAPVPKTPIEHAQQCPTIDGSKNLSSELISKLDRTLAQTKEARLWPVSPSNHCQRAFPYRFIIVSSSPTVVIGLPEDVQSIGTCHSINCLSSKSFQGYYEFADTFPHVPGLVWFSPEHGARLFAVPAHAKSIYLLINGKSLRLKKKRESWSIVNK